MNTKAIERIQRYAEFGEAILRLVKESGLARVKRRKAKARRKRKEATPKGEGVKTAKSPAVEAV